MTNFLDSHDDADITQQEWRYASGLMGDAKYLDESYERRIIDNLESPQDKVRASFRFESEYGLDKADGWRVLREISDSSSFDYKKPFYKRLLERYGDSIDGLTAANDAYIGRLRQRRH